MTPIIRFSMKNVSALFIIMILLFGSGLYSAGQLKQESMPEVSFPLVIVQTTYTGAPRDVMDNVTEPLEEKLANLEDIDMMSSTSSNNFSSIIVQFKENVDVDKKKQDIEDQIAQVSLPASAGTPRVMTFGVSSMATNYLALYAKEGMSQTDLDNEFNDTIKPQLEGLNGLDHMEVIGERTTSLDIELNADALTVYGLSLSQVSGAIKAALAESPIGSVEIDDNEKNARVTGKMDSIYELEQLEITTAGGDIVKLSQVANINAITESKFVGRMDGSPAIGIILYKAPNANAVEFSDGIHSLLQQWETTLPNITFKSIYDSADEIRESISGLLNEGILGAILASIMILVFLRNVRMTLIVLVSLPLSILITLLCMRLFGLTLNTMTLGGIFIAIGRVVDDSIVVIENIYSSLEKAQERKESVIVLATKQVSMAITSSTLATVGVFAPIGMISGIVGGFFKPFAITIACALLSSLLVALTVIPMLAKLLVLRSTIKGHAEDKPRRYVAFYERVLQWCLNHRVKTLLLTAVIFVGSIVGSVPFLKVSFLPSSEESHTMSFQLKLPYETSFETTNAITKQFEQILLDKKDSLGQPVFRFVEAFVGYAGDDEERMPYASQIVVEVNESLKPDVIREQMKQFMLAELPAGSTVEPRSIGGGFSMGTTDFSYTLKGEDQEQLEKAAAMVKDKLLTFPELSEVEDSLSDAKTEVEIAVDPGSARAYGFNVSSVMDTARQWIQEQELGDLKIDHVTYTTKIMMEKSFKNSLEKLGNIPLQTPDGSTVLLKEVAKIYEKPSASSLAREDQQQLVKVTAKINSDDKNRISMMVSMALGELELPEGVSPEVQGVSADIDESFSQLYVAMVVAVAVVYLIMVLGFGNASAPFAVLFSLPLAVIGGLIGLVVTGVTLDVTSMIGFMMLIGIVVTNAIVLIDRAQQLMEEGYVVRQALLEAGKVRLRPILMTAGATIMAMFPLALGLSHSGGLIGKGLAVVVIGGLTTSTILTLVIVPIIYEMLDQMKKRFARLFSKGKERNPQQTALEG